jgi:rhodanese-related sulfurtransferase
MRTRILSLTLLAAAFAWVAARADGPLPLVSQDDLLARLRSGADAPFVLDVRSPAEFAAGHVPGAANIPHDQVAARLAEVPKDRDVVLYCRSGRRTELAGEALAASGYTRLQHLDGDIAAWADKQRPMEVPRDPKACVAALEAGQSRPAACAAAD